MEGVQLTITTLFGTYAARETFAGGGIWLHTEWAGKEVISIKLQKLYSVGELWSSHIFR